MAEPAELREIAEKLVLAGVGAVALTAERADALAEELSARGGIGREEARSLIEEAVGRWRNETVAAGRADGRRARRALPRARARDARRARGAGAPGRAARAPAAAAREALACSKLWFRSAGGGLAGRPHVRAADRRLARAGRRLRGRARAARRRRRGRGQPLLRDRPPADRRVLAAADLLPRQGGAVRDPGGRAPRSAGSASSASAAARATARRCGTRASSCARATSSASTSRARGSASGTRGRCSRVG